MKLGNCFILVLIASACLFACSKKTASTSNPTPAKIPLWQRYKDTLVGEWTWSHTEYVSHNGSNTTYDDSNVVIPITLLNDSTLSVGGTTFIYSDSSYIVPGFGASLVDTAHTLYYYDPSSGGAGMGIYSLQFNRITDTAFLSSSFTASSGGTFTTIYQTYIKH